MTDTQPAAGHRDVIARALIASLSNNVYPVSQSGFRVMADQILSVLAISGAVVLDADQAAALKRTTDAVTYSKIVYAMTEEAGLAPIRTTAEVQLLGFVTDADLDALAAALKGE